MSPKTIRTVAGWAAVVAAVVGPFLPWVSRTSAAAMVRDLFFSEVSRPNAEWIVWLAAPLCAGVTGAVSLLRRAPMGLGTLVPSLVFLAAWAALLLTGYRAYTGFSALGFAVTWVGTVGLAVVVLTKGIGSRP